jgi:hypothetical protein
MALLLLPVTAMAQQDSAAPPRIRARVDTVRVQDAIYNRPFIASMGRTSIGGYVEGNTNYFADDGVSEGFSMELRRFNIFLFSAIGARFRFISELEFEDNAEEIKLETALLDFIINPSLVLRGGVLLPPVGQFNVRHDSPLWDVIDRPLVSTEIIPATLSEVGFGAHGRFYPSGFTMTYDAYVVQGLGDGIVLNEFGRTRLASGRANELFTENNNGRVALTGRVAAQHRTLGELGISGYSGVYNSYRADGVDVDDPRRVSIAAVDWSTAVLGASIRGEAAWSFIDVPPDLQGLFGSRQAGFFVDIVKPIFHPRVLGLKDATVSAVVRLEAVDYNQGTLPQTGEPAGDAVQAIVLGASFRPIAGTVFKFNYRREWIHDLVGNDPLNRAGFQFGLATYF